MDTERSDEELMEAYSSGDYSAFEELYARHRQSLFRFMLRLCSNRAVTEELFQDVWLKLIDARARYEVNAKFTSYLYQIARNRVIDHFRKHSTFSEVNSDNLDELESALNSEIDSEPERQAGLQQTMNELIQQLEKLPEEQKEVFLLKEEAGMNLTEIAEITNVNVETVKSRLRYAVKKLRQGLGSNQ